MLCPVDQATLLMMERQGIEIDYCPTCRGVWLDRGELDKLIEGGGPKETASAGEREMGSRGDERPRTEQPYRSDDGHRSEQRPEQRYDSDDRYKYEKKKKKEGFLKDLFDF